MWRKPLARHAGISWGPTHPTPSPTWSDQYDVNLEYRGHYARARTAPRRGEIAKACPSLSYLRDGLIDAVPVDERFRPTSSAAS
jgi:hypothetical protein